MKMKLMRSFRGRIGTQAFLCFVSAVLFQSPLLAQFSGTISGYVYDPSGAVIAGATVVATATEEGTTRSMPTNSTGFYNFVSMPRGLYMITSSAPGFTTETLKDVELTAGGNVREDFKMTVGEANQQVTVTTSAPMVETTTSTESSLVDDRRVQDLPLNGRNVVGLMLTMSNVNAVTTPETMADSRSGPTASVNGSRQNGNNYTLDGANFMEMDEYTPFNPPPPDAIQEIRIQTHDFPAEFGFTAGSQVSMVTKSGTMKFHGTAWEFFRNADLNARSYFQTVRPGQVQNQPGFTAGGPIKGGKLFYFGSYQQLWERTQAGQSVTPLPSAAERAGNFTAISTVLTNPTNPLTGLPLTSSSGQPCVANNIINSGCISAAATTIMKDYFPVNSANSIVTLTPSPYNNYNLLARIDYNVTPKNLAFLDFTFDHTSNSSLPGNLAYINQSIYTNIAQANLHDTHIFTAHLINEALVAYTYNKSKGGPDSVVLPTSLGVNIPLDPSGGRGISVGITGGPNLSYPGITDQNYVQMEMNEAISWLHGPHTFKFGYDGLWSHFYFKLALTRSLTFSGVETGNSEADFLLGRFDTATFNYGASDNSPVGWRHGLFAQDSYKITPRFTLDYGIRWEPFLPYTANTGRDLSFIPGDKSIVYTDAPPGILFQGDPELPHSLVFRRWNQFAPRLGFSWDIFGNQKTVIRAAGGTFYQAEGGDLTHASQAPWEGTDVIRNGLLDDPFGSLGLPQPPTDPDFHSFGCTPISVYPGLSCTFGLPVTPVYTAPHFKVPTSEQYTLNIQQQLSPSWVLETSYVGQPAFNQAGHNEFNAAVSENDPLTGAPPSAQNVNDRVTYSPGIFSPSFRVLGNFFHSSYNAWNISLRSSVIHGFLISAGYTRAKSMTNMSDTGVTIVSDVPDPFNLNLDRGPSLNDIRDSVAVSEVWSPKVSFSNRLLRGTLKDWTITGLHRIQSGTPPAILMGSDVAENGNSYAATSEIAMYAPGMTARNLGFSHPSRRAEINKYFNTAALESPKTIAAGTYGNVKRGALYGPGYVDHDISVMREIPLGFENVSTQIRGEFFNTFNDVNFNNPDVTATSAALGQIQGANVGRVIQLAIKIIW